MIDEADLLRAVIENPDDDTPRLIYADWLDDNCDSVRAEFIRVQIERWNRFGDDVHLADQDYLKLAAREKAIFYANHERWMEPLRQKGEPFQSRDTHGIYRRGFIHEVWMRARTLLNRAEKLFQRVPCRELKLTQASNTEFEMLSKSSIVNRLTSLDLRPISWSLGKIVDFVDSPVFRSLSRIEINADEWTEDWARVVMMTDLWPDTEIVFYSQHAMHLNDGDEPFHFIQLNSFHEELQKRFRKLTVIAAPPMSNNPSES